MVFRTCPVDIIEAISSLIFASARCGDFPELKLVRKLFEERFGQSFAVAAVELCPGNLVNSQVSGCSVVFKDCWVVNIETLI